MSSSSSTHEGSTPTADDVDSVTAKGLGPVVVLVPGLGLDGRSWGLVRQRLAGLSAVVLLPSLGRPAPRGTDFRVERQAERLLACLPAGQRTILVGHSASCPVVVETAARCGDVAGLVLLGPVTDPAAQTWPRMVSQWARTASHERPQETSVLLPQYRRTGPLCMLRGMDAIRHFRTDVALGRLAIPVEVVRGGKDRIASHAWCSDLQRASKGGLTTVQDGAHMIPLTHPTAVATAIDRVRSTAAETRCPQ
jgi:pimeloyl-ACP methyl ester carboxylesterase